LTFCSSFIFLFLIIISVDGDNGKNALAQPLPNSYDLIEPNTYQNDIRLIEDLSERKGEINEPEERKPDVIAKTDGSFDDSHEIEHKLYTDYDDGLYQGA